MDELVGLRGEEGLCSMHARTPLPLRRSFSALLYTCERRSAAHLARRVVGGGSSRPVFAASPRTPLVLHTPKPDACDGPATAPAAHASTAG
jgi:hypothetical protein